MKEVILVVMTVIVTLMVVMIAVWRWRWVDAVVVFGCGNGVGWLCGGGVRWSWRFVRDATRVFLREEE